MAKIKTKYVCSNCRNEESKWMGKCLNCQKWNTFEEVVQAPTVSSVTPTASTLAITIKGNDTSRKLKDVSSSEIPRIVTGISEFDRVMGGGIVEDSVTILSAPPGTGKSTLLTILSNVVAKLGYNVVYATGEESETQVKGRAERILKDIDDKVYIVADTSMENIVEAINNTNAKFIIIDSIQAVGLSHVNGAIGDTKQVMECAQLITKIAKNQNKAVIIIGQMTKDDELAGSRKLEHLVDTVLIFETQDELRLLRTTKNRFGNIGETGMFEMEDDGLNEVSNPSQYFLTDRDTPVAGCALCVIREGTRPILLEIESSVSKSFTPFPSRLSEGIRKDQLSILITILEQRAHIKLWEENVVVKTTGAMQIKESSVNLAILMSIASSAKNKPIPNGTIFIGEVGLTGEVKKVQSIESRIKEADRMGFNTVYIPNQNLKMDTSTLKNIKVVKVKTISECINQVLK